MPALFRAIALVSRPSGTMSGIIDCRAGIIRDITTPCTTALAIRCSTRSQAVATSAAITTAFATFTTWPACTTCLRGSRSARMPPGSESVSIGTAWASDITPSAAKEPVRSKTR